MSSLPPVSCPQLGSGAASASTARSSMSGCWLSATRTGPGTMSFDHDGGLMIVSNSEHIASDAAMNNDLPNPSRVSTLNTPLYLWNHLFADQRGYLALFSGARGDDPRKLLARAERYFSWPDEANAAVECALAESHKGRESYFCAHLLTENRRIKENCAPLRSLYARGDESYPGEGLP